MIVDIIWFYNDFLNNYTVILITSFSPMYVCVDCAPGAWRNKALLSPNKIYAHFFDVHGVTVKSCSKSKRILKDIQQTNYFYRHTSGKAADVTTGVARGDGCVTYNERPRTHKMAA